MAPYKCPCCGSRSQWQQADIYTPEKTSTEAARVVLTMFPRFLRGLRRHLGTRDVTYRCYHCGFEKRYHI